jgi:hypothetical protein
VIFSPCSQTHNQPSLSLWLEAQRVAEHQKDARPQKPRLTAGFYGADTSVRFQNKLKEFLPTPKPLMDTTTVASCQLKTSFVAFFLLTI